MILQIEEIDLIEMIAAYTYALKYSNKKEKGPDLMEFKPMAEDYIELAKKSGYFIK